jgi:hypothetical protein
MRIWSTCTCSSTVWMRQKPRRRRHGPPLIHLNLYLVDFLQHDSGGMEREAAGLMGKRGYEDQMLALESDTAVYGGRFSDARELTRRAADSARRTDEKEPAAEYTAEAAVREALVGNTLLAKREAHGGGTGFGPTSPNATYNTATTVSVKVGTESATVYGAALAPGYAGLYQVAIQIPASLANGDYPVLATISGAQSPATTLITVQQ